MNGRQLGTQNFVALIQVCEISPRKMLTGITVAARIHRFGAALVFGIAQFQHPGTREQVAIAGVPGRHNTIEHINTAPDPLEQISGRAHPHQVARLFRRQVVR